MNFEQAVLTMFKYIPRGVSEGGQGTVLRFEVKVAVLSSISKIETQNYDFFES